jgi:hypothetical protein
MRCSACSPSCTKARADPAGSLSGGQQQMVAIGRALMGRPKALLLDEPSLGLAPLVVKQMFEVIERINKAGTTVLLAEQNAYAALHRQPRLCDRRRAASCWKATATSCSTTRRCARRTSAPDPGHYHQETKETHEMHFPFTAAGLPPWPFAACCIRRRRGLRAGEVKIGYSGPLSGGAALYGKNVLTAWRWPSSEINAAGLEVAGKKVQAGDRRARRQVQPQRDRDQRAAPGAAAPDAGRAGAALGRHLRGAGFQRGSRSTCCWRTPACRRSPSAATS